MIEIFNEKLDKAIAFATKAHNGQFRKTDTSLPYVYHPIGVGFILLRAGFSDDVVIAAILHDVIEDSGISEEEINSYFGEKIKDLVVCVSENKKDQWEKRKADYFDKITKSSSDAKAIAVADKLHNIHNIIELLESGKDIDQLFSKDKNTTLRYYIHFSESISKIWQHPLVDELIKASKNLNKFINI